MTTLRISATTSCALDSLKARFQRITVAMAGATTTAALRKADVELKALAEEARALRIPVRAEIASAEKRDREDRIVRKVG